MPLFRRNTCNRGSPQLRRLTQLAVFLSAFSLAAFAHAATYYIAPNGSDGGAGDNGSPWRTFAHAIPRLNAGDTLLLKDGTYTPGTTGMPAINCPAGAKNGTEAAPITIQAEHERQAWLKGDGNTVVGINHCSYWNIVGLRASNADNPSGGSFFFAGLSQNINFRRNLLSNANRKLNQSMITYNTCKGGLIEENEIYDYLRHGFLLAHTENVKRLRGLRNRRRND